MSMIYLYSSGLLFYCTLFAPLDFETKRLRRNLGIQDLRSAVLFVISLKKISSGKPFAFSFFYLIQKSIARFVSVS
jgi:hypothetical protein